VVPEKKKRGWISSGRKTEHGGTGKQGKENSDTITFPYRAMKGKTSMDPRGPKHVRSPACLIPGVNFQAKKKKRSLVSRVPKVGPPGGKKRKRGGESGGTKEKQGNTITGPKLEKGVAGWVRTLWVGGK